MTRSRPSSPRAGPPRRRTARRSIPGCPRRTACSTAPHGRSALFVLVAHRVDRRCSSATSRSRRCGTTAVASSPRREWQPERDTIGIAAVLVGTRRGRAHRADRRVPARAAAPRCSSASTRRRGSRRSLVSLVDLMAAVPSIVYGLWGFFLLQPHAIYLVALAAPAPRLDPDLPGRHRPERRGVGAVAATPARRSSPASPSSMMVIPLACAVMRGVFAQAPIGEREAALALGATRWGMIRTVVLPFGRGGIIGGTMLGARPGARRDDRRAADHLAGLRHQVPAARGRHRDTSRR